MRTHGRPVPRGTNAANYFGGVDVLLTVADVTVLEAVGAVVAPLVPSDVPDAVPDGETLPVDVVKPDETPALVDEATATATVVSIDATALTLSASFAIPSPNLFSWISCFVSVSEVCASRI